MKQKLKVFIGIIIVAGALVFYAHIDKVSSIYDTNIDASQYIPTGILSTGTLEQDFVSQAEKLDGFTIKCSTGGDADLSVVTYSIVEKKTGNVLVQDELKTEIKSGKFLVVKFKDAVNNTKNKNLTVRFDIKNGDGQNGIIFYIAPTQKNEGFSVNSRTQNGILVFRTLTHRFDWETYIISMFFVLYLVTFVKLLYRLFK